MSNKDERKAARKLQEAIDKAFDRCNLIGEDCDVYAVLYKYKAIRELPEDQFEEIYDKIVHDLGFTW